MNEMLYCSFCGKVQTEVLCLIAGPACFICDECTTLCAEIVAERRKEHALKMAPYADLGPTVTHPTTGASHD